MKRREKNKVLMISLFTAGIICVAVILAVFIGAVYKNYKFKNALPDPEAAPSMYYLNVAGDSSFFCNDEKVSLFIPSLDFNTLYVSSLTDSVIDGLVLEESGELYANMLLSLCNSIKVNTIFYPSGMKKEYVELIKTAYPDAQLVKADKEGRYILGDYVLTFYGDKKHVDTYVQYGIHSMVVADQEIGSLVDKISCDFAIMPYASFIQSSIETDYVVFEQEAVIVKEEIIEKTMQYAVHPGYNYLALCMHNLENQKGEVLFNLSFTATGKLETQ